MIVDCLFYITKKDRFFKRSYIIFLRLLSVILRIQFEIILQIVHVLLHNFVAIQIESEIILQKVSEIVRESIKVILPLIHLNQLNLLII